MTNREALLEAALVSLQDKGYAATTARDVARGAGVSLGAIGYHYGSMQNLLDAALIEGVRRWFEPMISLVARPHSALTLHQLGAGIDHWLATLSANRPLVVAYFEALLRSERSPQLRTKLAVDFHMLHTALANRIEEALGDVSQDGAPSPQVAASLLMAAFDGLIIQWLLDPERVPSGQAIAETVQSAARLATTDPAPAPS